MRLTVCHKGTVGGVLTATLLLASAALGQTGPEWRKVGGFSFDLRLASPATGAVDQVWYSAGGSVLYARTQSGKIFETADFESWSPASAPTAAPELIAAAAVRSPEAGARIFALASNPSRIYAFGRQLSRSDDGGRSWTNLTAYRALSVVGAGQHSVAVSPIDPNQLVVANDFGVWRSMDGGLTWAGLNQTLPNLSIHRILSTPTGMAGARVQTDNAGVLELPAGASVWEPAISPEWSNEVELRRRYSVALGANIQAIATSEKTVYAGSSDGRIWISIDGGSTFPTPPWQAQGPVERLFADSSAPNVALAAIGVGAGPHILRTMNSGGIWDPMDSPSLPSVAAHGVTADRAAGAVYVATDKGVFYGTTDLNIRSANTVTWQSLTGMLPGVPAASAAMDVRLNPAGVQLYVAIDGYGVYATAAPHLASGIRIVNSADYSTRPAAPGSLLSVIGAQVQTARGGDLNYPVLVAGARESQIQVPFDAVGPNVSLALQTTSGVINMGLPMQPVSPIIWVSSDGVPSLYDADTNLPLDLRNAAHSNARVQILATGLGRVRPDWTANTPAPLQDAPVVAAQVRAFLNGLPLEVTKATLAGGWKGMYVVEVQLPAITNAGMSELYISADGQDSPKVQIWIEP
jgi:uncharacterized protein (TIGR03437 family)